MTNYTIKRITSESIGPVVVNFLFDCGEEIEKLYPTYDWTSFKIFRFVRDHLLWVAYRDDKPVGFLMAVQAGHIFDPSIRTLRQILLYSRPNTRASLLLLKEFIDFGKSNANHVITAIGQNTNIKPKSLEKLGFKKLEEIYRLET